MDMVFTFGILNIIEAGVITSFIGGSHFFFNKFLKQRAIEKKEEQKKKEEMKKITSL